ncbi:hypothetical protein [Flavobacterium hydrophilum]|uniref:Glycosyltransferase n=1 Tax=Flavobacterium hydrophilum TaxID=2211445 RepID=A0A2V4C6G8_9FLAO|nr:hypothetical protein [Flavobacterium hydrophilum]PXY45703.1 hypothetical protein DMB68_00470 [Flavobacterium hydrophilum]
MNIKDISVRVLKKAYRFFLIKKFENPYCDINRQSANDQIYDLLNDNKPCMIARFGTTELIAVNNYLCITSNEKYYKKIWNYISDKTHLPWWDEKHFKFMDVFSGIFPPTKETAEEFSKLYLSDTPQIDLLGSFQYYEKFMPLRSDVKYVHLECLYPFFVEKPWTRALKGKKVLVVHPFEETIQEQYKLKNKLFENPDLLPEFELITYKAIQSAAGIEVPYRDWFEALKLMQDQISEIDFDICILGCGAYGLPLAAHIKRIGKKAFHMGGGVQLLFGIKGKRWDTPSYGREYGIPELFVEPYCNLYNEYWTKPLKINTPDKASAIDGATYW